MPVNNRKTLSFATVLLAIPLFIGLALTPLQSATAAPLQKAKTVQEQCASSAQTAAICALSSMSIFAKPTTAAVTSSCAGWAPNQVKVLLCNLGLLGKPPVANNPPPVTPTEDDCGAVTTKANGTPWECTFVDNFDGSSLDRTKWVPQTNFSNGSNTRYACYVDSEDVVSQSDGTLKLSVKKVSPKVDCPGNLPKSDYAAGQISTFYKFSQKYGKFEAKIKTQALNKPGLQEAFWLWPDVRYSDTTTWPLSGEIDIVETYSQYNNLAIPFFHYVADLGGPQAGVNTAWNCVAHRGVWNTYTLEWTANRLEVFVNGQSCLVNTSGDGAFKKRYIVALTQALGTGANSWDGSNGVVPATMEVDYVKVWK